MKFQPAFSDIAGIVDSFTDLAREMNETSEAFAAHEGTTVAALRAVSFGERHAINVRYHKWLEARNAA